MDYSIIIPVFNKAHFTRQCLDTLRPTLEGAGDGEVIVIDNASSDETPELLTHYPWIRVIRNETNLGFAGANNQAARVAKGEFLVLLNNDTQGFPGWLVAMLATAREPGVGVVGAKLLFPDRTVQHAGVVIAGELFTKHGFTPYHHNYRLAADDPAVNVKRDFQIVTGACLVTPRTLYAELGGLDEAYWNGYEDVDYCLKVADRNLRVVYEPQATLFHFESQSGIQRFRKVTWNMNLLQERWRGRVRLDSSLASLSRGYIRRMAESGGLTESLPIPQTTVVVHGGEPPMGRAEFLAQLQANVVPVHRVIWATAEDSIDVAREAMELRGHRYGVLVSATARLEANWLDELIGQVESNPDCAAVTAAPELPVGENVTALAADARCTLLSLRQFPAHMRLGEFDTLDGAVADLLLRMLELERGTRGVTRVVAALPPSSEDASFEVVHGMQVARVLSTDLQDVIARLEARTPMVRGLVSIITLSWNAFEFTKIALDSIRAYTTEPYEVIVVDNGSGPETLQYLRSIDDPHVRVIYNQTNLGYGAGNNIGMAAAIGEHLILLNNDVVVTENWIEGLLAPFARIPSLGVTAPRSNLVAGVQQVPDALYDGIEGMHAYATRRRERWQRMGFLAERAIGLCLCIDRRVIDEIGGFDERFALGNFEDDDLCVRIRAAGYRIFICEDVFIHHFGSRSFAANKVDYTKTMHENWAKFAAKWGYGPVLSATGYDPRSASMNGFDRANHFAPLPRASARTHDDVVTEPARIVYYAVLSSDSQWAPVAEFIKRFARAYTASDPVSLAIGTFGEISAESIGNRAQRVLAKLGIRDALVANIDISDEEDTDAWIASLNASRVLNIASVADPSPSGLRRLLSAILV